MSNTTVLKCCSEKPFCVIPTTRDDPHLSKYQACFELEKELNLSEDMDKDNLRNRDSCYCCRIQHDDGNCCELQFNGISMRDSSSAHFGVPITALANVDSFLKSWWNSDSRKYHIFRLEWIQAENEREKLMKNLLENVKNAKKELKLQTSSFKALPYACYRLDGDQLQEGFQHFHNGGVCSQARTDYVTIYPAADNCPGQFLKIGTKSFVYCKRLLEEGWSPCCIQFCCGARPSALKGHYDPDCYYACLVLYDYWETILSYTQSVIFMELLDIMETAGYNRSCLRDLEITTLMQLQEIAGDVAESCLQIEECAYLMTFRSLIEEIISKNSA